MKLPNKIIPYNKSIISKFPVILNNLENKNMSVLELYRKVKPVTDDITEFLEVLDCLYGLGKIEYKEDLGVLHYVD